MSSLHTDGAAVLALWKNGGVAAKRHPKYSAPTPKALQRWNNEGGAPKPGDVASRTHRLKRRRKLSRPAKAAEDFGTGDLTETAPAAPPAKQTD